MKNKIFFLCLSFLFLTIIQAQKFKRDSLIKKTMIGIKTGINFPSLKYSNAGLNTYKNSVCERGILGIFLESEINKGGLSFRPEILLIGKGQEISDYGISYKMNSNYVELRFPFLYTYKHWKLIHPYLLLGPTLSFATGGKITMSEWKTNITNANIAPVDFGIIAGIGAKTPVNIWNLPFILSGEVAYSAGFVNTFSKKEIDSKAIALNTSSYMIDGNRLNRGVEATVSLALPLKTVSAIFIKKKKLVKIQEKKMDTLLVTEVPVIKKSEIPEKNCYTIDEMLTYLKMGYNVNSKKICLYNINFETNASVIDKKSLPYLNQIITLLNNFPIIKMKINGHTDNVGSERFNIRLSKKRALAVYNYLQTNGINADRLSYVFYGTRFPISTNNSEDGRSMNRRVEFEIIDNVNK